MSGHLELVVRFAVSAVCQPMTCGYEEVMICERLLLLAGVMAVVAAPQSSAEEAATKAAYEKAMNNLSHEYTICAAYYTIIADCLDNEAKSVELAKTYNKNAAILLDRALVLGEQIGLKTEAVTARLQIAMDEQMVAIESNCVNNSVLYVKYGEQCKKIAEDFEGAFKEYFDKAMQETSE
jgi:hypothetical protein